MASETGIDQGLRELAQVDRLVHEPARLMILMVLYTADVADFTFLVNTTELTDGNLSSHLAKLEAANYVEIEKGFEGKRPRTLLRLTEKGRQAVESYRSIMQQALKNMKHKPDKKT